MATSDFSVTIGQPTLVAPETPTPHEFKYLSNIDDQMGLRNHIPFIHVYRRPQNGPGCDPGPIIHQALSRALIHYYPLAGRLRNGGKEKLVVECTGEGMVYRDADADVTIELLRKANGGIRPPFRHLDRFLVNDVWGCNSIINSPLLRVQVTRLACGGFILAYTFNHCICDGFGAHQFITAVAELARNPTLTSPSIIPAWSREILAPRSPPNVTYTHPEYDQVDNVTPLPSPPTELDFRQLTQTSVSSPRTDGRPSSGRPPRGRTDVASLKRQERLWTPP
ncbi:uncharacterized protein A4U43_C01F28300 [Asparagus officinalis]|uniref:Uncharacterized protein n=1 Tax=Asparagus officinalis TaxID=4686 RepID=A0A5P1FT21_ASPOF|nr:uncharacterized protein A4U43_C01F28300 [Asparagus officinalis]